MNISIYQIDTAKDTNRIAFESLEAIEKIQGSKEIDAGIYNRVFSGNVDCQSLEEVFEMFNTNRPCDYKGRSLSVSDVVEVTESDIVKEGCYFCNDLGFKPIEFNSELAEEKIKVVMVEPGKKAYVTEIDTGLESIYKALGCEVFQTFYPFEDAVLIVCDDEGKLNGARPNRAIYGDDGKITDIIYGKFFICDCSGERFGSLTAAMLEKYKKQFLLPERFISINDTIHAVKYDPQKEAAR